MRLVPTIVALGALAAACNSPCIAASGIAKPDIAPSADDPNLLANPGFEDGAKTPDAWRVGDLPARVVIKRDTRVTHAGDASLMLRKTENRYWPYAEIAQSFERDPGEGALTIGAVCRATRATKVVIAAQFAGAGQSSHEWAVYIGAEDAGDPPVSHDWTPLEGTVAIPEWAETITVSLQIWGPGMARIDDVFARYAGADEAPPKPSINPIESELVAIDDDPRQRYILIDTDPDSRPDDGHRVLLVLPGGDGSADFRAFVEDIARRSVSDDYLVAQLIAPTWSMPDQLVWPTAANPDPEMAFSTERFVAEVLNDLRARDAIDEHSIFMLGWSSGGPPTYFTTTHPDSPVDGALVAMSVFHPENMPPRPAAQGKAFYLLHAPGDWIDMRFPRAAERTLTNLGATVTLETYEGGHGWPSNRFALIRDAIAWLEQHAPADD